VSTSDHPEIMGAQRTTPATDGCTSGCFAFLTPRRPSRRCDVLVDEEASTEFARTMSGLSSLASVVSSLAPGVDMPFRRETSSGSTGSSASRAQELDRCFELFQDGDPAAACELLAPDCAWHTMYEDKLEGRAAIGRWHAKEVAAGRKVERETEWVEVEPDVYQREIHVAVPRRATHEVVQRATFDGELIKEVVCEPKHPALRVALRFARAQSADDDEAAVEELSDDVGWKAWDGLEVRGKQRMRKFLREQRAREVTCPGESEFQAARYTKHGAHFERLVFIERVDGIKVRGRQRLYVRSEVSHVGSATAGGRQRRCFGVVRKIAKVEVLPIEEMINGRWRVAASHP